MSLIFVGAGPAGPTKLPALIVHIGPNNQHGQKWIHIDAAILVATRWSIRVAVESLTVYKKFITSDLTLVNDAVNEYQQNTGNSALAQVTVAPAGTSAAELAGTHAAMAVRNQGQHVEAHSSSVDRGEVGTAVQVQDVLSNPNMDVARLQGLGLNLPELLRLRMEYEVQQKEQQRKSELQQQEQQRLNEDHEMDQKHKEDAHVREQQRKDELHEAELAEQKREATRKADRHAREMELMKDSHDKQQARLDAMEKRGGTSRRKQTVVERYLEEQTVRDKMDEVFQHGADAPCNRCYNFPVSIFRFYIHGVLPQDPGPNFKLTKEQIQLVCVSCARKIGHSRVIHHSMPKERAVVWLMQSGTALTSTCAACLDSTVPVHVRDTCHKAHDVAHSKGGGGEPSNMRVTHTTCNLKMGDVTFAEYHSSIGKQSPADPYANEEALAKLRRQY